jgi:hypothetical protein
MRSCPVSILPQDHQALLHQVQDVLSAQINGMGQALAQLQQRHEAATTKMANEAAATRAQLTDLKQWFEANQVGSAMAGLTWRGAGQTLRWQCLYLLHETSLHKAGSQHGHTYKSTASVTKPQHAVLCYVVLHVVQVDAKLSEELLRQEVSEQQTQQAAALQAQLREQRHDLEAAQSELQSRVLELQAALKTLDANTESKVNNRVPSTTQSRFVLSRMGLSNNHGVATITWGKAIGGRSAEQVGEVTAASHSQQAQHL